MPSILSKILLPEWNLPYNCYELGHTWTPHCTEAALEMGLIVFRQSLKLYTPLYLANQAIFQRKYDWKTFKDSLQSILRSSSFLGINAFLVIICFCLTRQIFGRFYYTLCAHVPSFFGSLLAIFTERPSRRKALAFYVANIASETVYKMLVQRGYLRPIPNGQYLLFTFAITSLIYLYEQGLLRDPFVSFVLQLLLGKRKNSSTIKVDDNKTSNETSVKLISSTTTTTKTNAAKQPENDELITKRSTTYKINRALLWLYQQTLKQTTTYISPTIQTLFTSRHSSCTHASLGCVEEILLNGAMKPFLFGYFSQLALHTLPRIATVRPAVFMREYLLNSRHLLSNRHTAFGLFLATFATMYKTSRCVQRRITNQSSTCTSTSTSTNENHHHTSSSSNTIAILVASLLASPAHFIAPSTSVSLYLVWKAIEAWFNLGIKRGLIPYPQVWVHTLYAFATSELFYAAVLEPKHIKPSYKRFLDRVTDHKLNHINRNVLEVFGTNSAAGYESVMPVYDIRYTTRRFQESVLVWLL